MAPLIAAFFTPLFNHVLFPYGSMQVAAVWAVKHPVARMAALLPIIPMWRVIMIGMQPAAWGGGSLYGIIIMFVQWPCMVYLGIFVLVGLAFRIAKYEPEPETKLDAEDKSHTSRSTASGDDSTRE